jgi:hypothetical protein
MKKPADTHQEIYRFPYEIEAFKTSYVKCLKVSFIEGNPDIIVLERALKAGRNTGGFNYKYWYLVKTKTLVEIRVISIAEVNSRKKRTIYDT